MEIITIILAIAVTAIISRFFILKYKRKQKEKERIKNHLLNLIDEIVTTKRDYNLIFSRETPKESIFATQYKDALRRFVKELHGA